MHKSRESPAGNRLLDALPDDERARLLADLDGVTLSLGDIIYEPGGSLDHIYVPTTSVVSLLYTMEDGMTAEMGLAGNDGAVGSLCFGEAIQPPTVRSCSLRAAPIEWRPT